MSARRLAGIVAGVVVAAVVLVFGSMFVLLPLLMGDPPPDPGEAPLEVVAQDADGGGCILNRADVAAGVHEISVYTGGTGASVELRDVRGHLMVRREPGSDGSASARTIDGSTGLQLEEGRYTFVCRYPGGATGETPLTVTPG